MIAMLSYEIAEKFTSETGIKSIALPSYDRLDMPVCSHADMLICKIDNKIFCYNDYYFNNKGVFSSLENKYEIVRVQKPCMKKYPEDIALNVLVIGKRLFCNEKHTASEIKEYAKENGYKIINVSQGYSACSTLVIDDSHAITADKGIYKALLNEKIDTLLISNDKITLNGYNCGFVGGSGGVFNKTAYFFGDISTLDDFEKIKAFLEGNNCNIFCISLTDVYDFGGIKFV